MKSFSLLIIAVLAAGGAQATTCSGKWGNAAATSVQLKSNGTVNYCFETQCWTSTVYKNGNNYLFRVGDSGASVELIASGTGFKATWKSGNDAAKATLSCK